MRRPGGRRGRARAEQRTALEADSHDGRSQGRGGTQPWSRRRTPRSEGTGDSPWCGLRDVLVRRTLMENAMDEKTRVRGNDRRGVLRTASRMLLWAWALFAGSLAASAQVPCPQPTQGCPLVCGETTSVDCSGQVPPGVTFQVFFAGSGTGSRASPTAREEAPAAPVARAGGTSR